MQVGLKSSHMSSQVLAEDVNEFFQLKSKTPILGALSDEQVASLVNQMSIVSYKDGDTIFMSGESASSIYIVLRGRVRLDFGDEKNPLSQIQFQPGDCFGETSVIGIQPHSASALANGSVDLFELDTMTLNAIYESDTKLFATLVMNIAREASRRLHHTDSLFLEYTKTTKLAAVQ